MNLNYNFNIKRLKIHLLHIKQKTNEKPTCVAQRRLLLRGVSASTDCVDMISRSVRVGHFGIVIPNSFVSFRCGTRPCADPGGHQVDFGSGLWRNVGKHETTWPWNSLLRSHSLDKNSRTTNFLFFFLVSVSSSRSIPKIAFRKPIERAQDNSTRDSFNIHFVK